MGNVPEFHELVRRMFLHRRKYMRHVLADIWRDQWSKADVDAWLEERGLSGQLRAEALDVEEFVALAQARFRTLGWASTRILTRSGCLFPGGGGRILGRG